MNIFKNVLHAFSIAGAVLVMSSCEKIKRVEPLGDAGQTLVKFIDGGTQQEPGSRLMNMEAVAEAQAFEGVDLRRDIPNNAALNKTMTVVIKYDGGAVTSVDSEAEPLPLENVVFNDRVEVVGDEFRVQLKPGEFALPINFSVINADQLDLSKAFGLGFTITTVDADGKILDEQKSFVVMLSSNNKWDGVYRLYSGFSRADQPGFVGVTMGPTGYYQPYYLVTKGATDVDACINTVDYGIVCSQIIWNAGTGNYTYFTGVAPRLHIDKNTNAVTVIPGEAIVPPSVDFLQSAAELADSRYYEDGIAGHPFADGKPTIVAHFKWTSAGVDRVAKDTFVYLQPR